MNQVPLRQHVWGMEVYLHTFLTSELDGSEYPASRFARFSSRVRSSQYPVYSGSKKCEADHTVHMFQAAEDRHIAHRSCCTRQCLFYLFQMLQWRLCLLISGLNFGTVLWKLRIMESFVIKCGIESYSCEQIIIMYILQICVA